MKTIHYLAGGMIRRFKVTESNPKDFKTGDKYIVIGVSTEIQTVSSEKNAQKLNDSIMNEDKIRRVLN
jgi:hypothetical protein